MALSFLEAPRLYSDGGVEFKDLPELSSTVGAMVYLPDRLLKKGEARIGWVVKSANGFEYTKAGEDKFRQGISEQEAQNGLTKLRSVIGQADLRSLIEETSHTPIKVIDLRWRDRATWILSIRGVMYIVNREGVYVEIQPEHAFMLQYWTNKSN